MLSIFFMYLVLGALAGLLSGLLGIGGGIIVVPGLLYIFSQRNDVPVEIMMHLVAGTSLTIVILTCASSAAAFWRKNLISWPLFYRFMPGLFAGVISGSTIAQHLSSNHLRWLFALFLVLVAVQIILFARSESKPRTLSGFNYWVLIPSSIVTGILSALFGVGGGLIMVPVFLYMGCEMLVASGTSALSGLPTAIVGSISLSITGMLSTHSVKLPFGTTGYVFWPAVIMVGLSSMLFAPLGTRLAVSCKASTLRSVFGLLLLITAWKMF